MAGTQPASDADQVKVIGPLRIRIPLFNIYLNEADERSRRLATELAEWALELQPAGGREHASRWRIRWPAIRPPWATPICPPGARAGACADALRSARGHGMADEAQLFADAAEEIRRLLHQFAAGFLKPCRPGLLQRLAEHERMVAPAPVAQLNAARSPNASSPIGRSRRSRRCPQFTGVRAAPSCARSASSPAAPQREVACCRAGRRRGADALDDEDDIDAVDAVDAELFPIFEEEGEELLPQLQSRMREWARRPTEAAAASACMRTLHTLKGGARLAGAMRLGEMAHRLETAIEHLLGARPRQRRRHRARCSVASTRSQTRFETLRSRRRLDAAAADAAGSRSRRLPVDRGREAARGAAGAAVAMPEAAPLPSAAPQAPLVQPAPTETPRRSGSHRAVTMAAPAAVIDWRPLRRALGRSDRGGCRSPRRRPASRRCACARSCSTAWSTRPAR